MHFMHESQNINNSQHTPVELEKRIHILLITLLSQNKCLSSKLDTEGKVVHKYDMSAEWAETTSRLTLNY